MKYSRRDFIKTGTLAGLAGSLVPASLRAEVEAQKVMTVQGSIRAGQMGLTLIHEHI